MNFGGIETPAAAFVAGLVTSLHCAAMCGPLACMLTPGRGESTSPQIVATVYHVSRMTAYMMVGAIAGAIGRMPLSWLSESTLRYVPWLLVLLFLALAFRLDRWIRRPMWLTKWSWRLQARVRGGSRLRTAAALGLATPLLPCGPLYMLVAIGALSGSATRGAEFMLAFGLGTIPLLWIAQANFGWLRARLAPVWYARVRTIVALAAALMLAWRLRATLGFSGPDVAAFICGF